MVASNSVFISYRRAVGFAWARLVWEELADHGHDAFLDLESLRDAGHFDRKILNQIAARPYFLPVLVPDSLRRCPDPDDWLRRELDYAVATDRAIVPLIVDGFDFAEADECLPEQTAHALRTSNGVSLVAEYFSEGMRRLREDRLKPIELSVRTLTDEDHDFAEEAQRRASEAYAELPPPVQPATTEPDGGTDSHSDDETAPPAPPPGEPSDEQRPPVRRRWVIAAVAAATLLVAVVITVVALRDSSDSTASDDPSGDVAVGTESPASTNATTSRSDDDRGDVEGTELGSVVAPGVHLDDELGRGDVLASREGDHRLALTDEGALEATTAGVPWPSQPATDEDGEMVVGGDFWKFQGDGNLVLYTAADRPLWDSRTADGARVARGDDVELAIFDDRGTGVLEISVNGASIWTCRSDECPVTDAPTGSSTAPDTTDPPPTTAGLIEVPPLTGLTRTDAEAELQERGLQVGALVGDFGSDQPLGTVTDQSIEPGTLVEPETTVDLLISADRDRGTSRDTLDDDAVLAP